MKKQILAFNILFTTAISGLVMAGEQSAFEKPVQEIAGQIRRKLPLNEKTVLLVVPFQGVGGKSTSLGTYLSEKLNIELANQGVTVLERKSLDTLLAERKLLETGLLDESTVVSVGKSLGAKFVLYGTAVETKNVIGVNLKIVNIELGNTIGGVCYDIKKTRPINKIINTFPDSEAERQAAYKEPNTKFTIGISYLAAFPTDTKQFDAGSGQQVTLLYDLAEHFDIELSAGRFHEDIKDGSLPKGKISMAAFQGGLRFNFMGDVQISPYISAGVVLYEVSQQDYQVTYTPINGCSEELDGCSANLKTGYGGYGGVGANIHLNRARTFTISLDARYAPANTSSKSRTFEIGQILSTVGLMYRY